MEDGCGAQGFVAVEIASSLALLAMTYGRTGCRWGPRGVERRGYNKMRRALRSFIYMEVFL